MGHKKWLINVLEGVINGFGHEKRPAPGGE